MTKKIFASIIMLWCISASLFAQDNSVNTIMTKKYNKATNLVVWPDEFNPEKSKFYVHNEIEINAKPEVVWDILIDAKKWHTYYSGAQSPIEFMGSDATYLQQNMTFKFHTMGLKFQPVINEFIPNQKLAWTSRIKSIQGYHAWVIVPTNNGCRLITAESQNGFLTFMQKVFQPNKLLNLHEHWLQVIKARAEQTAPRLTEIEKSKMNDILNSSLIKFNNAVNNLSEAQLNFRPATGKWSITECIEHIALAELEFPEILEREMQQLANPTLRSKIRMQDDEIQPKMTSKKWKAKSPEIFKPSSKFANASEAITAFHNQRNKTISYVETTKDDLRNHHWKHPLTGKIDLYQTLILMSAHLERHIEQIENVKLSTYFPKN